MKVLIWVGCFLVFALVKVLFLRNVSLGGIASALYWGALFGVAYLLGKKWDRHKAEKHGASATKD